MKKLNQIILVSLLTWMISGCSKEEIPYYDSARDAVRFENNSRYGYDATTATLYKSYSFCEAPLDEYTIFSIPLGLVGNKSDKDRTVACVVDAELSTAPANLYEILDATIPADSLTGQVRVKIYNPTDEETYTLVLRLGTSPDLEAGPAAYLKASLSWNNTIPEPSNNNVVRTYNMLIKSTLAFTSTSKANYSPAALKLIVAAFGWNDWNDPAAHPEYPYAASYFLYPYLPDYRIVYAELTYASYAANLGKYIANYNLTHEPLRHDAGGLIGQPIEARTY